MARFRKAAIAAVALSALALTTTAASAHALTGSSSRASTSSMSWGYYAGPLFDISTGKDVFGGARATAMMIAVDGGSFFSLRVRGIDDTSDGKKYPVHLHEGPCVAGDGAAALGHYNDDKMNNVANWIASATNEVWLDLEVNSEGEARSTSRVKFVPKADKRSIVIHSDAAPVPPATSPARLACLPLEIKKVR